jgi:hypothetical protein
VKLGAFDDSGSVAETSDFLVLARRGGTTPSGSNVGALVVFRDGALIVPRRGGGVVSGF